LPTLRFQHILDIGIRNGERPHQRRYLEPYALGREEREVLTVEVAMERLSESARDAFAAENKLIEILKREGIFVAKTPARRLK